MNVVLQTSYHFGRCCILFICSLILYCVMRTELHLSVRCVQYLVIGFPAYVLTLTIMLIKVIIVNTSKYHVSCTHGKISVRISLLFYLYFPPSSHPTVVCFFPVDLSSLIEHFQQILWVWRFILSPGLGRMSSQDKMIQYTNFSPHQ